MINYEHFRLTDAHEAALDLSDLFNVSLQVALLGELAGEFGPGSELYSARDCTFRTMSFCSDVCFMIFVVCVWVFVMSHACV